MKSTLRARWLNFDQRQSKLDEILHEAALIAACDTVLKWRYVKGEINLHEYLIREEMFNKIV